MSTAYTLIGTVLPFTQHLALWLDRDAAVEATPRVLVDEDRPFDDLGVRLQPRGHVDGVADARVGGALVRPGVARDNPS